MADEADRAQPRIEIAGADSLARVIARLAGDGRGDCAICGDPIDPDRRAALPSATCCHPCQEALERQARLYPRQPRTRP